VPARPQMLLPGKRILGPMLTIELLTISYLFNPLLFIRNLVNYKVYEVFVKGDFSKRKTLRSLEGFSFKNLIEVLNPRTHRHSQEIYRKRLWQSHHLYHQARSSLILLHSYRSQYYTQQLSPALLQYRSCSRY